MSREEQEIETACAQCADPARLIGAHRHTGCCYLARVVWVTEKIILLDHQANA